MEKRYYLIKKRICPKCKSNNLTFSKTYTTSIAISKEINKDFFICMGETSQDEISGVLASCHKCKYVWKLKKVVDFEDIFKEKCI